MSKALDEMKKGNADAPIRSIENHKEKKGSNSTFDNRYEKCNK